MLQFDVDAKKKVSPHHQRLFATGREQGHTQDHAEKNVFFPLSLYIHIVYFIFNNLTCNFILNKSFFNYIKMKNRWQAISCFWFSHWWNL